jgi:nifR3 family TIM-barrel protein
LTLGALALDPPVLLSPMAGVTNPAFRRLCFEQLLAGLDWGGAPRSDEARPSGIQQGETATLTAVPGPSRPASANGLFVAEMITSRGIVERNPKTFSMLRFFDSEVRAVQLYGVEPRVVADGARVLAAELGVRLIDLNFGCPVPKVTRRGGGGALPWKLDRLAAIMAAVVEAVAPFDVPVTAKFRIGIDDAHPTWLDAGRLAAEAGFAAVTLHARTVQQAYSGQADWGAIAALVAALPIPVIGNGDVWEADDALRMMAETGCAGVSVGRGALGRPWLFRDLARAFSASPGGNARYLPTLGEVAEMVLRHGELLAELHGERHGVTDLRKHMAWYFRGFPVGGELRHALATVSSLAELGELLGRLDPSVPFPLEELGVPRGRQGSPRAKVVLPYGWLESRVLGTADISDAESDASGG